MSELLDDISTGTNDDIKVWDNSMRAKYVIVVFSLMTVFLAVGLYTSYSELQLLDRVLLGDVVTHEEVNDNDIHQGGIAIIQLLIQFIAMILFLNWFRRAYANLERVGISTLSHKENMTVWAWFIPIYNLFAPAKIMYEIWVVTQRKIKEFDSSYVFKRGFLSIGLWWLLFVIASILSRYAIRQSGKGDTIEEIIDVSELIMISDAIFLPAALCVIWLVAQVSKMEEKLAQEVKKAGGRILDPQGLSNPN